MTRRPVGVADVRARDANGALYDEARFPDDMVEACIAEAHNELTAITKWHYRRRAIVIVRTVDDDGTIRLPRPVVSVEKIDGVTASIPGVLLRKYEGILTQPSRAGAEIEIELTVGEDGFEIGKDDGLRGAFLDRCVHALHNAPSVADPRADRFVAPSGTFVFAMLPAPDSTGIPAITAVYRRNLHRRI